jgi:hypothetical protein
MAVHTGGLKYNQGMKINPKLYREAREHYRQWNEAELIERARNAGKLKPREAWKQYASLWAFAMQLGTPQGPTAQRLQAEAWDVYYQKIRRFELSRGKVATRT